MPFRHWSFYTDESRGGTDRYMVFGGLAVPDAIVTPILDEIASFRHASELYGEFKWTKVSRAKLPEYCALADIVFRHIALHGVRFHCMTVDAAQLDYRLYHDGDRDRGNSVLYYTTLNGAFTRRYGHNGKLQARLDFSDSKTSAEELRKILNNGAARRFGIKHRPYRSVTRVNSKRFDLVQAADVLLGAVGWHKNARQTGPNCSQWKCQLADHIAAKARLPHLVGPTPYEKEDFTIWHWVPNADKCPPA